MLTTISLPFHSLWSQVIIGGLDNPKPGAILDLNSAVKGGLLLPNISIPDLGKIPGGKTFVGIDQEQDTNHELTGTVVYNTNVKTGTGIYVWDGENWRRISSGGSMTIVGDKNNTEPFKSDGTTENFYTVVDPSKMPGDYTFTWISGEHYLEHFNVIDAGNGQFFVKFKKNDQASPRYAVLLVTGPDGKSITHVFTQEGDTAGCGMTTNIPKIKSEYTNELCTGGAVYLYLENPSATGVYVWTLNGEEVGRGIRYTATKPGVYVVYGDKVGCPSHSDPFQVLWSGTTAPSPVRIKSIENNGEVCGNNTVKITVTNPPVGAKLYWYKDGIRQSIFIDQPEINVGEGVWQAVVVEGSCSSVFSEAAVVTRSSLGALDPPVIKINEETDSLMWSFCMGGLAYLEVANYDPQNTYTWYADNVVIGTGSGVFYSVPSSPGWVYLRLLATSPGKCAAETSIMQQIGPGRAPQAPEIKGDNVICGGRTELTAVTSPPVASPKFYWYKDGVPLASVAQGGAIKTIIVDEPGLYNVAVMDGLCLSSKSKTVEVVLSDFTMLSWVQNPDSANYGETKVYRVSATNGPVSYKWTITQDGNDITSTALKNGQGTEVAVVTFPDNGGDVNIAVSGENNCGEALNNDLMAANIIRLKSDCLTPQIVSPSGSQTINVFEGEIVTLRVIAANLSSPSYAWMKIENGQPRPIGNSSSSDYNFIATKSGGTQTETTQYYCIVTNKCTGSNRKTATSPTFTVNVSESPQNLRPGDGKLAGKTCFDIVESNFTSDCGLRDIRIRTKADFMTMPISEKTYTFTVIGSNVSNLHFSVIDPEGCLDSSNPYYTPNSIPQGNLMNGSEYKVVLNYRKDLNTSYNPRIIGRTGENAAQVKLYAVYNDGLENVMVSLSI
ncbi:MAG: immunoglobulin domain-containing protein, partial [Dysgonamonadaceae bacterium]|nr:immunoglobulin domain-containing protein [Dysgonamonadaceae bacterium]